ncbi:hypothetical protein GCM10010916_44660 [Paenibacillus abyssi]|uniref:Copper amine oxidase-like N-terminal domain-containing protein n=2 Tax=Paenibacillus abyssi TaxID=1340531 RepID=A0A917LH42_9BACL|nr:hypothetical protein GCM10010916_44660 [Paenibacillus abyssi]
MIPLTVLKQFGVAIVENKKVKTWKTMKGSHYAIFKLNSKSYTLPKNKRQLQQPAQMINQTLYIPAEAFFDILKAKKALVIRDAAFIIQDTSIWTPENEAANIVLKGQKLKPEFYIDRKAVPFKTKPVIEGGIAYFPIKELYEYVGAKVEEDHRAGKVSIIHHKTIHTYTDGSPHYTYHDVSDSADWPVEELTIEGDVPVKRINGVFMMPHVGFDGPTAVRNPTNLQYGDVGIVANGRWIFERQVYYTYNIRSFYRDIDEHGNEITDSDEDMDGGNEKATFVSFMSKSYTVKDKGTQYWGGMVRNQNLSGGKVRRMEIEFNSHLENGKAVGALVYKTEIMDTEGNYTAESEKSIYTAVPLKDGFPSFSWDEAMTALDIKK